MRFVFLDGHYAPDLSEPGKLTTAYSIDQGTFTLRVPTGLYPEPLCFEYQNTGLTSTHLTRNIILEDNTQVKWVEKHTSPLHYEKKPACIENKIDTEIVLGRDTQLHKLKFDCLAEHIQHTESLTSVQRKNSFLGSYLDIHSDNCRNILNHVLEEDHAQCESIGLYQAKRNASIAIELTMHHKASYTRSEQLFKGTASDTAHTLFKGTICVDTALKKITAHQRNNNLLLSRKAKIVTQPELIIHSEEVSCTHGATISQLEESLLFYCQSRGISIEATQKLLTQGFLKEVVERFPKALTEILTLQKESYDTLH